MKKSIVILAGLTLCLAATSWADEDLGGSEGMSTTSPGSKPNAPVLLAENFPAVQSSNPLHYLPGMSHSKVGSASINALPQELLTHLSNVPNPFDSRKAGLEGETVLSYDLVADGSVTVTLFDLLGVKVRNWDFSAGQNGARQGTNTVTWDGTNEAGQKVSKGGYIAQVVVETPTGSATAIRKIGVIH